MKSRFVCALFAFFGGFIGLDLFYRRKYLRGILNVILCPTGLPIIFGVFRGVRALWMDSDEEFNEKMVNND